MSNKFKNGTSKSKELRNIKFNKKVIVFCEGDTEYNYITDAKKCIDFDLNIKPVDMNGGGYSNFLKIIQKQANDNCIMKFIIVDGDRISNDNGEKKAFLELIQYCKNENKKSTNGERPYIIIVNNPNFEYVACLHCCEYKAQDLQKFIKENLTHQDLDAFKKDKNVYNKLNNSTNCSYKNVLGHIANRKMYMVKNEYETLFPPQYIKFNELVINEDNMYTKCTNIDDFYDILWNSDRANTSTCSV